MAIASGLRSPATTRIRTADGAPWRTPRQQRSRRTFEDILEAAAQVFDTEGLGATTNRIAERAGYSIGTLYQYFPDKWALLCALADRHIDSAHEHFDAVLSRLRETRPGWEEVVRQVAEAVAEVHRRHPGLHALMHAYAPRIPAGVAKLEALHATLVAELAEHLQRCGRGGPDPQHTAALLVHAAEAQYHRVLLGRGDGAEELSRALLAMTP
jgi:AcrR family transcriptional regulator